MATTENFEFAPFPARAEPVATVTLDASPHPVRIVTLALPRAPSREGDKMEEVEEPPISYGHGDVTVRSIRPCLSTEPRRTE